MVWIESLKVNVGGPQKGRLDLVNKHAAGSLAGLLGHWLCLLGCWLLARLDRRLLLLGS